MQVASSLVLARHIAPRDYGFFALATTIVAFARYVGDLGIANSLVPPKAVARGDLETGAAVAVITSLVAVGLLAAFAAFGTFTGVPTTTRTITLVLGTALVVDAFRFGPTVALYRDLSFGRISGIGTIETAVMYAAQIAGLLLGFGLAALVAAQLVRSAVATSLWIAWGGGVVRPAIRTKAFPLVRRGFVYQAPAIVTALSGLVFPIAVAAELGTTGLGFWAWSTILATPITGMVFILHGIAMPSFARLREADPAREIEAVELVGRVSLLIAASAAGVLVGVAPRLVPLAFGEKWVPAVGAAQIYLIGLLPSAAAALLAALLESRQLARVRLVAASLSAVVAFALIFPLGAAYGVTGAAIATAAVAPLLDAILLWVRARVPLTRPIRNGIVTFLLGLGITTSLITPESTIISVTGSAVLALLVVLVAAWVLDRDALRTTFRLARASG